MLAYDIVIIGGGISGLWTLNRLRQEGYQAILLEKNALGSGQTIASQGIIHGGIKYSLQGTLSASSQEISDMPAIWRACLAQQGKIDLSSVKILSDYYYLCSQQKITQSITQFFAQKALRSHSAALDKHHYPEFFNNPLFTGKLTQVDELVLDVPSLIQALAKPMRPFIFKVNDLDLKQDVFKNKKIILTAGEGNAALLPDVPMQTRALHMVMLSADNLPKVYLHCVGLNTNPVLTITSHLAHHGQTIWYLGGQLAEDGVQRDEATQIQTAAQLIQQQFPWFTLKNPRWKTLRINRAEGFNHGKRPESVMMNVQDQIITAWPTKLTFAPLLAENVLQCLIKQNGQTQSSPLPTWPKPALAITPWDDLC